MRALIPRAELDEIWKDVLLNCFHDVLPGTTISLVVDDVMDIYRRRSKQGKELLEKALATAYPGTEAITAPTDGSALVIDPLRTEREELVQNAQGDLVLVKTDSTGLGGIVPAPANASAPKAYVEGDKHILENDHFRFVISSGRITSLVDKRLDRELILAGPGSPNGGLNLYEDYPLRYDAWDAEIYHLDMCTLLEFNEVTPEETPLRASLTALARFGKSVASLKVR